jgi:hypothetical protein
MRGWRLKKFPLTFTGVSRAGCLLPGRSPDGLQSLVFVLVVLVRLGQRGIAAV